METQERPKLIIVEEKHNTFYYLANDEKEMARVALSILRRRHEEGYWYPKVEELEKAKADTLARIEERAEPMALLSSEEIDQLPESLRDEAKEKVERHRRKKNNSSREYSHDLEFISLLEELLAMDEDEALEKRVGTRSGKPGKRLATRLLEARADYQYEGFTVELLENR